MSNHTPKLPPPEVLDRLKANYTILPVEGRIVARASGKEVGAIDKYGYYRMELLVLGQKTYLKRSHIVFWVATGKWPTQQLDHIDRNKSNDCISNLREVSSRQNLLNKGASERLLPVGVHFRTENCYMAQYNNKYLGSAPTSQEAHQIYLRHVTQLESQGGS